ncbi:MAG: hypothetical protein PWR16_149 [Methanoculleus sp.]|nr:hypothetical protein [Methanoculleus sp.]
MTRAVAVMASVFIIFALAGFAGAQELPAAGNLTNAGSAYAAEYRNGTSVTRLAGENETPNVSLEPVAGGFVAPLMLTDAGDGTGRLFVVDQVGTVSVIDGNGTLLEEPFLDVRDRMVDLNPAFDERGLLSIAFHPAFRENGRVFAFYSAPLRPEGPEGWDCTNRVSEFRLDPAGPDRADMASERVLLEIDKPQSTHNGGSVAFGPRDGYLYVPLGDGGGAGDSGTGHTPETGNAQDPANIYGSVLRIDVDDISAGNVPENATRATGAGVLYGVPADNPFVANASIPPEIYAYGFRNPAFISFDAEGNLYVADAGQDLFEEVSLVTGGGNYGWRLREGTHCFDLLNFRTPPGTCEAVGRRGEPLIGPIIEGGRDLGPVIIGGRVYNGTALPDLSGHYVFGYWNGNFAAAAPPPGWNASGFPGSAENLTPEDVAMWRLQRLNVTPAESTGAFLLGFGEDEDSEIYALTTGVAGPDPSTATGRVWKIVPANATAPLQT